MRYGPARVIAAAMLLGMLGACTHAGSAPAVASVAGATPSAATSSAPSSQQQELAFVACMRNDGVANMPDPTPGDTSGRSAVKNALDVMKLGDNPTFQAALDKCMNLLPPVPAPTPASNSQLAAEIQYAQCMRAHGITTFKDPKPDGTWNDNWLADTPTASKAIAACDHLMPKPSTSPSKQG